MEIQTFDHLVQDICSCLTNSGYCFLLKKLNIFLKSVYWTACEFLECIFVLHIIFIFYFFWLLIKLEEKKFSPLLYS